jgi:hypothetical protein
VSSGLEFRVSRSPLGAAGDDCLPTSDRYAIPIADIAEIEDLGDPSWLVDSNAAAAVRRAEGLLKRGE